MYIWQLKETKKSNDLVVTSRGINSFIPISDRAFTKVLYGLEKFGVITTIRQRNKNSDVTVLFDNCHEEDPTLKIHNKLGITHLK